MPLSLKERRETLGLSQRELADALGIPVRSLQNYEIGHRTPRPAMAALLDRALAQIERDREHGVKKAGKR